MELLLAFVLMSVVFASLYHGAAFVIRIAKRIILLTHCGYRQMLHLRDTWSNHEEKKLRHEMWEEMASQTPLAPNEYDLARARYIERVSQVRRMPLPEQRINELCAEAERRFYQEIASL